MGLLVPDELRAVLLARGAGQVWLESLGADPSLSFDSVAVAAGLRANDGDWQELGPADAELLMAALIHRSIAYTSVELMPVADAYRLAAQFLAIVGMSGCRFGSNQHSRGRGRPSLIEVPLEGGFSPLTDWTFDTGLVAISDAGAVLYWVAEED